MATTAIVLSDVAEPNGRRRVVYEFTSDNGTTWRKSPRIAAGVDAQADADSRIAGQDGVRRKLEMEQLIGRCMAGEDPATIVLDLVARPRLFEVMTRRLHNGPRLGMEAEDMRGLAQWIVGRATPAIRSDLKNVRTNTEVNQLKTQWQALLDADVDEFDDIGEDD